MGQELDFWECQPTWRTRKKSNWLVERTAHCRCVMTTSNQPCSSAEKPRKLMTYQHAFLPSTVKKFKHRKGEHSFPCPLGARQGIPRTICSKEVWDGHRGGRATIPGIAKFSNTDPEAHQWLGKMSWLQSQPSSKEPEHTHLSWWGRCPRC